MSLDKLPIPGFCRFQEADKWTYQIDYGQLFEVASVFRDKFGVGSIAANQPRINLLLIDTQKDFTLKEGSLLLLPWQQQLMSLVVEAAVKNVKNFPFPKEVQP